MAGGNSAAIQVEGLAQFSRALRRIDGEMPKQLRIALNGAADVVVQYGRQKAPKRTGRGAGTIRAQSTRTSVRVTEGGARARYMPWLDFGGRVGRRRSVIRPFITEGRFLYPALREKRAELESALESALTRVAQQAGMEVG